MRTVISVASALACAFSLDAQIATTLNHLPDGSDEVRIRNNSATSLVASVVAGKRVIPGPASPGDSLRGVDRAADAAANSAPFVVYSDPLIEPAMRPLLASEERVAMVSGVAQRNSSGRRLERCTISRGGRRLSNISERSLCVGVANRQRRQASPRIVGNPRMRD